MLRRVRKVLLLAILGYAMACLFVFAFIDKLVFLPSKLEHEGIYKSVLPMRQTLVTDVVLEGWYRDRGTPKIIVYFGGNGDDVLGALPTLERLVKKSYITFNYRGFGRSEGEPSERLVVRDAQRIFDHVRDELGFKEENIQLIGKSLGAGVAVQLAATRNTGEVMLITPFDSAYSVARRYLFWVPLEALMTNEFRSVDYIAEVNAPVIAVLAEHDRRIPISHGDRLIAASGGRVERVLIEGADHETVVADEGFIAVLQRF